MIGHRGEDQKNMRDVPLKQVAEYACEDADVTLQVCHVIRPDIEAQGVSQVCYEVECPLIPCWWRWSTQGSGLDTDSLADYSNN